VGMGRAGLVIMYLRCLVLLKYVAFPASRNYS
jgi:hypothetical protein